MDLGKKIKYKIKIPLVDWLMRFSLKNNLPILTALSLSLAATKANRHSQYTVLCLGRSIFTNDIEALAHFGKKIKYLVINLKYFDFLLNHFILAEDFKNITESNYHNANFGQAGKQNLNQYLKKVLPYWQRFSGFSAVMSGNFGYVQQQELAKVCEAKRVPFIVLNKEGIAIPGAFEKYTEQYKNHHFFGAKMLLYNKQIKKALLTTKIAGLTEDKLKIVGVPRLDYYFFERTNNNSANQKKITFFSFFPRDKFWYAIANDQELNQIENRSIEFHYWVMLFAQKYPEYQVIIKTKVAEHYVDYVSKILKERFNEPINNLKIINVGNPVELIKQAKVILGFNSTTLLEAIADDKLIITPYFGDIITGRNWDYFSDYPDLVNYAKTYEELENYLVSPNKYLNQENNKNKFLESYIFTPDGKSCQRTETEIIKTIRKPEFYETN
ncbi:MAG: hypothetical protein A2729_05815 [Candidatus Buchananbacteria bacterium RIFCSPHIGHO2_01_FULL_39_14]|uniref:Uncharacterized protein n=1 Tax=Candidatus Buchananbacteria bacterium RIFCSPHIGHO2_01_FULL_39_14 TaxID=1797532 RepID=A0A1G1XSQ3_9BACT|nr:MAG: hypothetical protein A2729_05815 [Candidatus Buchananbacteria bacterium RIFCSPHIGHO2_01_FULL_39_14]OGY48678.1 MAG: hypothetical protein A3D39_05440 [Candidatus Buchananbacteria bacterium RIFCSPHIGHO2_02_FULL_39_17]